MIIIPEYNRKEKMKYCQGPLCHTYDTKDRKRGPKGNKVNQTRRRSSMYYGSGNFCSLNCYNDWAEEFIDRAVDYFGRLTQPRILAEDNAWRKRRTWGWGNEPATYYFYNVATGEERQISQEQYLDNGYNLNSV